MKSTVYFAPARGTPDKNKFHRISDLLDRLEFARRFEVNDLIAIKAHWGEGGNADFLPSFYLRHIARAVKGAKAKPFVTDTNTLYRGSRFHAVDNLLTAAANGFTLATLGCPVVVADGLRGTDFVEVEINGEFVDKARIASAFVKADGMVVVSHVKGHMVFGFGGALKNLAMGCAAGAAKQSLHADIRPRVKGHKCVACGDCIRHCRFGAITMVEGKKKSVASIDHDVCTGCGECIVVCPEHAIPIDWGSDYEATQRKAAEYALAAVQGKGDKCVFINFLISITPDCDCCSWSDAPIMPDVGYAVSDDPVALDKASVDIINDFAGFPDRYQVESGKDRFLELHKVDWRPALEHAAKIGLGNLDYDLVTLE